MESPVVLVTGSSGHLGTTLVLALPSHGFTPLGIDILPSTTTDLICDIRDPAQVARVFASHHISHVIHAATLHKPHVLSHTKSDFIQTNISGTLHLLEAATTPRPGPNPNPNSHPLPSSFIYISTTSAFGTSLLSPLGSPATWITETTPTPAPKNIYGATKTAAEDLCHLFHRETGLPTVVLRTSRFFPEADDDADRRASLPDDANLKVCELAYRRVDIADVVAACVCAVRRAGEVKWGRYVVSAPPPPGMRDATTLALLGVDAGGVLRRAVPAAGEVFAARGWRFLERVDRVYDSSRAVRELGWQPEFTFEKVVERLARGEDWGSELAARVGKRGYHAVSTGVYTVR